MCFDIGSRQLGCWGQNTSRIQNKEVYATLYLQALYRYALGALVSTIKVLNITDPQLGVYKDSLARLRAPPSAPVGSKYPGYWIGEGVPLSSGHRTCFSFAGNERVMLGQG